MSRRPTSPIRNLSTKQAGALVGRSDWWVRQRIERGEIGASNVSATRGRPVWRTSEEDLRAYFAARDRDQPRRPQTAVRRVS